jgi:hypothetical protein
MSNNDVTISYSLYADPSALEGVARLFDFAGTLNTYNSSLSEIEADTKAMAHDWVTVGADLQNALNMYEQEKQATSA